jgi:alginate O-acetyltransferase complex protein AlgI
MIEFNFYYSLTFWVFCILIALLSRLFSAKPGIRFSLILLSSSLMLLAIPHFTWPHLVALLSLSFIVFLISIPLNRQAPTPPPPGNKVLLIAGILLVLAFLAFFKYQFLQDLLMSRQSAKGAAPALFIRFIGVSYFSFKMIHFLVESFRKKIEKPNLLNYFNYILFFPSFISGPINRYNHFSSQVNSRPGAKTGPDLRAGAERIVHGLFKKFVLVPIFYPYILGNRAANLGDLSLWDLMIGLYAYALYFYFDFSGYSDLAIGTARLIGFELPENFNNPFLKKNIRELWTNWHMSLTGWLVDYIYWPLVRKLRNREYFRGHPILLSNLGMIITFIICGMWHGEASNFIVWGAYHGFGIAVLTIYQRKKRSIQSSSIQAYFRSTASGIIGSVATFNFFAFGLIFFVMDLNKLKVIASGLWNRL